MGRSDGGGAVAAKLDVGTLVVTMSAVKGGFGDGGVGSYFDGSGVDGCVSAKVVLVTAVSRRWRCCSGQWWCRCILLRGCCRFGGVRDVVCVQMR